MLSENLTIVLPEIVLALYAMAALMWAVFRGHDREAERVTIATIAVFLGLAAWIALTGEGRAMAFDGAFVDDGFARFAKVLILVGAAMMLLIGIDYLKRHDLLRFEFPVLIALATLGMLVMVSASDLITLYMGLELQSLALYVVAAFRRDSLKSTEAGLKYFVLGALSSGLLLYGASLVYGYTGTTVFASIQSVVAEEGMSIGLIVGLVFICAAMAFKISAVPFHMWTPDVYEGSPTPVTAFFSAAPKVAAAVLFARILHDAFGFAVADWQQILVLLAVASMFLGSIAAIGQTDIKRLMAYSSIGHMGFALVGLAAGTEAGVEALLIYLSIYLVMNVGVFAFILNMERDGRPVSDIAALGMLSAVQPARAAAVAILMFSLAGIPPFVGFFGKLYVFRAAVDAGLVPLAIAGVIASVIGAYYYLRIVYLMYFGTPGEALTGRMSTSQWVALSGASIAMVAGVINLFGVEAVASSAAATLLN
ncbi:MAG: NADH-quinone oxidoreductase subunit NuoN [Pseudomonadota bacterium]